MEISKERILEAASKCPQAKETLKTLFPEVFEDDQYFDFSKLDAQYILKSGIWPKDFADDSIQIRKAGRWHNKGFYLHSRNIHWEIVTDEGDALILLPSKRKKNKQ